MSSDYEVFNPNNVPEEDLPVIYGFNNGGSTSWWHGQLLAEDGTPMGSHLCSHESYMYGDLGILKGTRTDRHEGFRDHYPDGYRMDFVPSDEMESHKHFNEVLELALKLQKESKGSDAKVEVTVTDG